MQTAMPTTEQIKAMGTDEFDALVAEFAAWERKTGLANVGRCDRSRWCGCSDTTEAEAYYEAESGAHGYFHDPALGGCGGITQTG